MGRTFCSESGRVLVAEHEELSRWRWARKSLTLPPEAARAPALLWLYVCTYPACPAPLEVTLNGERLASVDPADVPAETWAWQRLDVPAGALRAGENTVVLSSEQPAMNGWMLGLAPGHREPQSALSTDRGETWSSEAMGIHHALRGEYLVRLWSAARELDEAEPPTITYEDPHHPRVAELRALIPPTIRDEPDPWRQLLALRSHVARAWRHQAVGARYAPWDAATILAWMQGDWGHGAPRPTAMCVHFGVVMSALATALGHTARAAAITDDLAGPHGHFMAEVWDDRRGRWVVHDANLDLHYEDERGEPLSLCDLADAARGAPPFTPRLCRGPGCTDRRPAILSLLNEHLATGSSFTRAAVWARNHVLSHPPAAPPAHGSVSYCETDLLWYAPDDDAALTMFPHRIASRAFFEAAPREHAHA